LKFDNIEQLAELMEKYKLTEVSYEEADKFSIKLKSGSAQPVYAAAPAAAGAAPAAAAPAVDSDAGLHIITSELVGTFYASASPDSPAYANVGDTIEVDSTVCIVEAMKVMNEIKSEVSGTIVEILVDNATPVEFGQAIMKVKPN
jgi:acetyl-CoA carboxylase biotin carboxyl carrier protein